MARYGYEKRDRDDGGIVYEIWDYGSTADYRCVAVVAEDPVDDESPVEDRGRALKDARLVTDALNKFAA